MTQWSPDDINYLVNAIKTRKSYKEIYEHFNGTFTESAIRKKKKVLVDTRKDLIEFRENSQKPVWSKEELETLEQNIRLGKTPEEIISLFPRRTSKAVKIAITNSPVFKAQRNQKIDNLPWEELEEKGIVLVEPDKWVLETISENSPSLFCLVTFDFMQDVKTAVTKLRKIVKIAENEQKTGIRFCLTKNKQFFIQQESSKKKKDRMMRKVNQTVKNFFYASILGDAGMDVKQSKTNIVFQFTQAANLLTKKDVYCLKKEP